MNPNIPSKYLPVWKQLKTVGHCELVAHPSDHKRILKGVRQQRDNDLAYRMQLLDDRLKHRIAARSTGTLVKITLTTYKSTVELL